MPNSFDILGNIAILKFPEKTNKKEKIKTAREVLNVNKSVKTILEKTEKVHGRLRTIKTVYLAGERSKLALYKENNCIFKFDVDKTYFSPRLSNERKEIASQVKKNESVLVMFAGVAPFSIVIAKLAKPKFVYSVEINREASKYALENVRLNKTFNVEIVQGDVKKVIQKQGLIVKGKLIPLQFDRIVMPRPQLKETFLNLAFKVIKKGGIINYYGFSKDQEEIINSINEQAKKAKKQIKIILVKKAGNIAPYKYRWRVDLRVMS